MAESIQELIEFINSHPDWEARVVDIQIVSDSVFPALIDEEEEDSV